MAERDGNVFLPDFSNSPFNDVLAQGLRPPGPIQVQNPNGAVPRSGVVAAIADKFLSGVQQGRTRAYMVQQAAESQKRQAIMAKLAQIQNNPDLTPEAKSQAYGIAAKALAGDVQMSLDGGKGKGKKDQDHNPALGLIKKLAQGVTGGPLPKGTKIDLGGTLAALSMYDDPSTGGVKKQYSLNEKKSDLQQRVSAATKDAISEADYYKAIEPFRPEFERLYGGAEEAERRIASGARGYQRMDPVEEQLFRQRKQQQQGQAPPGAKPYTALPGVVVPTQKLVGGAAPPGAQQGSMTPEMTTAMFYAREGFPLGQPKLMVTPEGKQVMARPFAHPEGVGYLDDAGHPLPSGALDATVKSQMDARESQIDKRLADIDAQNERLRQSQERIADQERRTADSERRMNQMAFQFQQNLALRQELEARKLHDKGVALGQSIQKQYEGMITTLVTRQNSEMTRIRSSQNMDKATQDAEIQRSNTAFEKQKRDIEAQEQRQLGDISKDYGVSFDQSGQAKTEKASAILKRLLK